MTQIFPGGSNIFIKAGVTQGFTFTFNNPDWIDGGFNQPQPLSAGSLMSYTNPSISIDGDGFYSWLQFFTNNGPNDCFYNAQTTLT
jgi:hypothetical protein